MSVSGSRVHVVWFDERDGNTEIYYKRDPSGNPLETPGAAPDGAGIPGTPLLVRKELPGSSEGSRLVLSWGGSCSPSGIDHAVYEGALGSFTSHAPVSCTTGGERAFTVTPSDGSRYYLVVPHDEEHEGSYGTDSAGAQRPPGAAACLPQLVASCP